MTAQELFEMMNNLRSSGVDLSSIEITKEVWIEDPGMRDIFLRNLEAVNGISVLEKMLIIE
jgi:hypothetical protein